MLHGVIDANTRRVFRWTLVLWAAATLLPAQTIGALSVTSGASYATGKLAPDSIGSAFGQNLAPSLVAASSAELPVTLGGVQVSIKDSSGATLAAPLFFVSPGQINFLVPAGTKLGAATVHVAAYDGKAYEGSVVIENTTPGLFSATADGKGVAAATVDVYGPDSKLKSSTAVFKLDATNKIVANPVSLGGAADQAFLVLYATGVRSHPGLSSVKVMIGGATDCAVAYAGQQGQYWGLDQVNVRLPFSLAGRGTVTVAATVEGRSANTVSMQIAASPLPPALSYMTPSSAQLGDTVAAFSISGTNLANGVLRFSPPGGIQVSNLVVTATSVNARLTIDPGAEATVRDVTVTTDGGVSNTLKFTVRPTPAPSLTSPSGTAAAEAGKTTSFQLTGSNLGAVNRVELFPPDGITVSNLTSTTTSVRFDLAVASDAAYGDRKLAVWGTGGRSNQITLSVFLTDPTLVISNLQAGPGTNTPYAKVPVSYDYNDSRGLMANGASWHYEVSNGSLGVTYFTYSGNSVGTKSVTLDFSDFRVRWNLGVVVPIKVWIEAPAGRRSNVLAGGFQTQ